MTSKSAGSALHIHSYLTPIDQCAYWNYLVEKSTFVFVMLGRVVSAASGDCGVGGNLLRSVLVTPSR
jgi:hypothetical protein